MRNFFPPTITSQITIVQSLEFLSSIFVIFVLESLERLDLFCFLLLRNVSFKNRRHHTKVHGPPRTTILVDGDVHHSISWLQSDDMTSYPSTLIVRVFLSGFMGVSGGNSSNSSVGMKYCRSSRPSLHLRHVGDGFDEWQYYLCCSNSPTFFVFDRHHRRG